MIKIEKKTFHTDYAQLPTEIKLAHLGRGINAHIRRLTSSIYEYHPGLGGPHFYIGTLEEIIPLISELPVSEPYVIPPFSTKHLERKPIELDLSDLDNLQIDL